MANVNCLRGIRCPECGGEDDFDIEVSVIARFTDDGVTEYFEPDWGDDSNIECRNWIDEDPYVCENYGKVSEFRIQDLGPTDE